MVERIKVSNEDDMHKVIDTLMGLDLSRPYVVEWKQYRKKRSLNQNDLMHKWFQVIAEHTGDTPSNVKEDLKKEFLQTDIRESVTGKLYTIVQGTSELDTKEGSEFMAQVEAWAFNFLNVRLPSPQDLGYENYNT